MGNRLRIPRYAEVRLYDCDGDGAAVVIRPRGASVFSTATLHTAITFRDGALALDEKGLRLAQAMIDDERVVILLFRSLIEAGAFTATLRPEPVT